jgi:hypothetical protein
MLWQEKKAPINKNIYWIAISIIFHILAHYGVSISQKPHDYDIIMDRCYNSSISKYCDTISTMIFGQNTTRVCSSLRIQLFESGLFTRDCIDVFHDAETKYIDIHYPVSLFIYHISILAIFISIGKTITIDLYGIITRHYDTINYLYTVSLIMLAILIPSYAVQLTIHKLHAENQEIINTRDSIYYTCRKHHDYCDDIESLIYSENSPINTCSRLANSMRWSARQKQLCIDLYAPTKIYHAEFIQYDYYLPVTIFMYFTVLAALTLEYMIDLARDVKSE